MLMEAYKVTSWVGSGTCLGHFPIFLKLEKNDENPLGPFKFNPFWVQNEEFQKIVNRE